MDAHPGPPLRYSRQLRLRAECTDDCSIAVEVVDAEDDRVVRERDGRDEGFIECAVRIGRAWDDQPADLAAGGSVE